MAMAAVEFAEPASESQLEALAEKLRARNFEVVIVNDGAEAKAEVLKRIPEGAQVHSGKSKTLEDAGLFKEYMGNEKYDFVRRRTMKMDQKTQRGDKDQAHADHGSGLHARPDHDHPGPRTNRRLTSPGKLLPAKWGGVRRSRTEGRAGSNSSPRRGAPTNFTPPHEVGRWPAKPDGGADQLLAN